MHVDAGVDDRGCCWRRCRTRCGRRCLPRGSRCDGRRCRRRCRRFGAAALRFQRLVVVLIYVAARWRILFGETLRRHRTAAWRLRCLSATRSIVIFVTWCGAVGRCAVLVAGTVECQVEYLRHFSVAPSECRAVPAPQPNVRACTGFLTGFSDGKAGSYAVSAGPYMSLYAYGAILGSQKKELFLFFEPCAL